MGAGARLAEERGRWSDQWRIVDLDLASERLLDSLDPGEELWTAVPGFRNQAPHHEDAVLIGVTDRRVLVVGADGASPTADRVGVADATRAMTRIVEDGTFTVRLGMPGGDVEIDLDPVDLVRLRELVDELGA